MTVKCSFWTEKCADKKSLRRVIMKKGILIVGIGLLLLSGCAFGTRRPLLTYTTALPPAPKNNITVTVAPFKDQRVWSKEKLGDVRNGYGMRCADIIPQNSVTDWLRDAFRKELVNAGYTIYEDAKADTDLEGTALEVYVNAYMSYGGKIKLNITLKKDDKAILSKEYYTEKNCGLAWASTEESFAKTIEMTLQEIMKKIIPDINGVLLKNEAKAQ